MHHGKQAQKLLFLFFLMLFLWCFRSLMRSACKHVRFCNVRTIFTLLCVYYGYRENSSFSFGFTSINGRMQCCYTHSLSNFDLAMMMRCRMLFSADAFVGLKTKFSFLLLKMLSLFKSNSNKMRPTLVIRIDVLVSAYAL